MNFTPLPRRLRDYVVIAAGLAAVALYFSLRTYWVIAPDFDGSQRKVANALDSVRIACGLNSDSATSTIKPVSYAATGEAIAYSSNLVYAREYLRRHGIPTAGYEEITATGRSSPVNFRVGTTTATPGRASDKTTLLVTRVSISGEVDKVERRMNISLSGRDSASVLRELLKYAPEKFRPAALGWKPDTSAAPPGSIRFRAQLGAFDYHKETLTVGAEPVGTGNNEQWLISWERERVPLRLPTETVNDRGYIGVFTAVVVVLFLLAGIILFFLQLRKRTVSLTLAFAVATAVTLYLLMSSLSFAPKMGIGPIVLIFLSLFIFAGFLLGGMPVSGIVALAQQAFPEKFYTIYRLVRRPWTSHYAGRSIICGISASFVGASMFPLLFAGAHSFGLDKLMIPQVFSGAVVQFLQNPAMLAVAVFLFVPCVSLGVSLVAPALAYSFLPEKFRFASALAGSIVVGALLATLQSSPELSVLFEGALTGGLFFMVFRLYDVLSAVIYSLFSSFLLFLPLTADIPALQVIFYAAPAAIFLLGIAGFIRRPEVIHEEDYKPQFLYRIEDEKRLREELMAAQVVQRRLLPAKMPAFPTLDIAAACLPAFEVGGDYYDFFPLSNTKLGVLIADVSGKGMSAAFYITLAKGVIVSQIQQSPSPADVLRRVNRLLHGTMERGKFISMIYGVLDTEAMTFTYAQAGHNPLLVYRAAGNAVETGAKRGIALGLDAGDKFDKAMSDNTLALGGGDALLLYTDGANEAVDIDGEEFGMERLTACLRPARSSTELLDGIVAALRSFAGKAKQRDDITLVVVMPAANAAARLAG